MFSAALSGGGFEEGKERGRQLISFNSVLLF